jgi:hypothetical protein
MTAYHSTSIQDRFDGEELQRLEIEVHAVDIW